MSEVFTNTDSTGQCLLVNLVCFHRSSGVNSSGHLSYTSGERTDSLEAIIIGFHQKRSPARNGKCDRLPRKSSQNRGRSYERCAKKFYRNGMPGLSDSSANRRLQAKSHRGQAVQRKFSGLCLRQCLLDTAASRTSSSETCSKS